MASTSPGSANYLSGKQQQHFIPPAEDGSNVSHLVPPGGMRGQQHQHQHQQQQQQQQQQQLMAGFPPRDGMSSRDSGYSVCTSDGASTCSSSTTDPAEGGEGGTLLVLEPKSLRSFTTNDEYLYAMKEDLADWFSCLYKSDVTADNFWSTLETGVLLCQHSNKVQGFARQRREQGDCLEMRSYFIRNIPEGNVPFRTNVKPETFQARDNVSNFISWGRQLGIPEVLSFETDDLVLRKNEKSVILCLLEIARVGAKLGMLAPTLVQMEEEIDAELAGEEVKPQVQIKTCDMRSLDEMVRDLIGRCTCPIQFPMVKVGDGKYKIGDSRSLIFVRILRNHVMVRVGGGWDTLENYLNKHDPCQCNYRGHRGPSAAAAAHKISVSQQRRASVPANPIPSPRFPPTAATPPTGAATNSNATAVSPRRMSTTAAHRHRSTSPRAPVRSKSPGLVISRQQTPAGQRTEAVNVPRSATEGDRRQSPARQSPVRHATSTAGSASSQSQSCSQYAMVRNNCNNNSAQLGSQPSRCKSPGPGVGGAAASRLRSASPLTATSAIPTAAAANNTKASILPRPAVARAASSSALLKGNGQGHPEIKVGTPRSIKRSAMISNHSNASSQEEEDEYDYNGCIVASDTTFLHQNNGPRMYGKYGDVVRQDGAEEEGEKIQQHEEDGYEEAIAYDLEAREEDEDDDHDEDQEYLMPGSVSFDERTESSNDIDQDGADSGQGEGRKANMSMDKISTMTLSEFKSLLTSALSVPEEEKSSPSSNCQASQGNRRPGVTSTASTPGASDANRQLNWGSVREKAMSVRDSISSSVSTRRPASTSNSPAIGRRSLPQSPDVDRSEPHWRPRTPQATRKFTSAGSSSGSSSVVSVVARPKTPSGMSRPKTPTAIARPKTPSSGIPTSGRPKTPTSSDQRGGHREEYKMVRPRTPSQMKREAVAKVAGAISNWVDSRPEMDDSSPATSGLATALRPKSPARTLGTTASFDENDEDGAEVASAMANPRVAAISSSLRDRPDTPSRIPKPCFTPRPITPKATGNDVTSFSTNRDRSVSSSPPMPPQTLSLSHNISNSFSASPGSVRKKNVISRAVNSNSNTSSPVMSPQTSIDQDILSKSSNQYTRSSSGRIQPQTPTKTYKDLYTTRRCNTPGAQPVPVPAPRSQPSRCVTPGPREKWSFAENPEEQNHFNNNNNNNRSRGGNPTAKCRSSSNDSHRNGSGSTMQRSSSINNLHSKQMMVTNEITFSDDEEIEEMMRNATIRTVAKKPSAKPLGPRSASVDAKKLIRQNASAGQEVLVISRNNQGNHGFQVMRKNDGSSPVVKRPSSRGNSTDRSLAKSSKPGNFRSQTPDPSMFRRKLSSARSMGSNDTADSASAAIPKSGTKSFNRTEAWVDSTLSDTKRKHPPRPKRGKANGVDFPASELEPRTLEEIKAMLSDPPPQNDGTSLVDATALDAPPEDPEMFRKMEKLFEKYREMELRASVNDIPGAPDGIPATGAATNSRTADRAPSHRSLTAASSRSAHSGASLKTSSGSLGSSSGGGRSSNPPAANARSHNTTRTSSIRSSISEEHHIKRSTSSPGGSFHKSPGGASPGVLSPAQESNQFPVISNSDNAHNGRGIDRGTVISESNSTTSNVLSCLKDIDSEVAKNPAALISKIKEILQVRPRRDENSQLRTRIPAPRSLAKTKRSKSVSNLFQVDGISSDLTIATSDGRDDIGMGQSRYHGQSDDQNGQRLSRANSSSNSNIAYSEFIFTDQNGGQEDDDVMTSMVRTSSVQSDSGDSASRCETPAPKLATPLTTGRSTFINRKGLSQDKENTLSNSQTSLSSRSLMSTTEDEADFV